jgi:hypothetical protein
MSYKKQIALQYLHLLEQGNISGLIELFDKDGLVDSPIYGVNKADKFYIQLFDVTSSSNLEFLENFESPDSNTFALHFNYNWTLKNGKKIAFEVVDIIELNDSNKIQRLKIIYDTAKVRELLDK